MARGRSICGRVIGWVCPLPAPTHHPSHQHSNIPTYLYMSIHLYISADQPDIGAGSSPPLRKELSPARLSWRKVGNSFEKRGLEGRGCPSHYQKNYII